MTFGQFRCVGTLQKFFWSSCGGPIFVGAPVRPNMLNMPKSASGNDVSSDLYRQLLSFRACAGTFIQKAKDPQDVLNVIMSLEMSLCFPDVVTAYTIFLTLPVSSEHSFSKLKLLKTYLRAAMSHDRLSDLGILSIERDMLRLTSITLKP